MAHPNPVVDSKFCHPSEINLAIHDAYFIVEGMDPSFYFTVKHNHANSSRQTLLIEGRDKPVLTLHPKLISAHNKWKVFRGDSTEREDLLFKVKRSSLLQPRTTLDVFLVTNKKKAVCDFKVQGSGLDRSFTVYAGESSKILAQKKHTVEGVVTIYPDVDYAFIVSLIVILEGIEAGAGRSGFGSVVGKVGGAVLTTLSAGMGGYCYYS